jgi:hypothetical protein
MFVAALFIVGLLAGGILGRWWAILVALGLAMWVAWEVPVENSEPPHPEVGLVAALIGVGGVVAGVAIRRLFRPR